jgi:hypothetical protein
MKYFEIEPEVGGGWGDNTVVNRSTNPPTVVKLHYEFDGWLGDAIQTASPCYIARVELAQAIEQTGLTGVRFAEVETSTSGEFKQFFPGLELPEFCWMLIDDRPGEDDFGIHKNERWILVVSKRALALIRRFGLNHAEIRDFEASGETLGSRQRV